MDNKELNNSLKLIKELAETRALAMQLLNGFNKCYKEFLIECDSSGMIKYESIIKKAEAFLGGGENG